MKSMEKVKSNDIRRINTIDWKKVIVDGKEIGIFLTESGDIHAINNICPHKQGPLSEGTVSGDYVYCPLHDQKVDLRSGEVQEPDTGCVETYQVEVIDGDVYVCL